MKVALPAVEAGDADSLAAQVLARWRPVELCHLLQHWDADVRRVAAVTLGLVGDMSIVPCLSRALRDPDEQVNEMAEHGLWSIWFRGGSTRAARSFQEGVALLSTEAYDDAIECFEQATRIDPQFAEAYNQCAIAHFFMGRWRSSIDACRKALKLVPTHFGAMAGMGHSYVQMGDLSRAMDCYMRALVINPKMHAIAGAIQGLRRKAAKAGDKSPKPKPKAKSLPIALPTISQSLQQPSAADSIFLD